MKPPRINEAVRLGRGFLVLYALALLLSLWLFHPWSAGDRYMAVLSVALLPFLGSLVLYSLGLFSWSVATDFRRQRMPLLVLGIALTGILLAFSIANWRQRPIPSFAVWIVIPLADSLLRYLSRRLPAPSADPGPAPAGEGGAPGGVADRGKAGRGVGT